MPTRETKSGAKPRQIYIEDGLWTQLRVTATANHMTASNLVRVVMDAWVKKQVTKGSGASGRPTA